MTEYTANVVWHPAAEVEDEDLFDLSGDDWSTVVSREGAHLHATLTIDRGDYAAALAAAVDHCLEAIAGELVAAEIVTPAEQQRRLDAPARPPLVGLTEVAELLGVSRQRANQLRSNQAFPAPTAQLSSGPVWYADDISTFASTWTRKPGRPAAS